MANRTVKVTLAAEVSSYIRELDKAERKTEDLADEIENLTQSDIDGMADGLAGLADGLDDAGDAARRAARSVDALDDEISKVERNLTDLHLQFAETADEGKRLDLSKEIGKTEAALRSLSKSRDVVASLIPDPSAVAAAGTDLGRGLGKAVGSGLGDGLSLSNPKVIAALAGVAVLAAPFISAAVSGAVIGGVGAGGVAGGVALAATDPRVASAGKALGARLFSNLKDDAKVFVGPVLEQIDVIGDRFDTLRPRFQRIFGNSAQFLAPLTDGLLDMLDSLMAGIESVVGDAGPVMDSLGRGFATLGESLGRTLVILGGGSEDAAKALDLLFRSVGEVTENIALLIRGATEVYGAMDGIGSAVNGTARDLLGLEDANKRVTGSGTFAADALSGLGDNTVLLGMKAQGAEGPIYTLSRGINELADASRNAFDAATSVGEAIDKVTEAAGKNGKTLDANTKAGRENRTALSNLARSMIDAYNAEVALNGEGEKSAGVASRNREKFVQLASAMTGSKKRAEELANQLGLIPGRKTINVTDNFNAAKARARGIQAELDRIPRTIRTRVIVTRTGEITYGGGGGRQAPQMAEGGPVIGPGPKGRDSELRMLAPGEHVWTAPEVDAVGGHAAVMSMRAAALGGGSNSTMIARPAAGGTTTIVHEKRIVLEGRGSLGQLLVGELRGSYGLAGSMVKLLDNARVS